MGRTALIGPRVRGTCPRGHDTVTNAAAGRVTWVGQCEADHNGKPCGLKVTCRRFTEVDLTAAPPPAPAASSAGVEPIPKVGAYLAPSDPASREPGFGLPAPSDPGPDPGIQPTPAQADDGRPAGRLEPGPEPEPDPGVHGPGGGDPSVGGGRRGFGRRIPRRGRPELEQLGDWTVPGVYP